VRKLHSYVLKSNCSACGNRSLHVVTPVRVKITFMHVLFSHVCVSVFAGLFGADANKNKLVKSKRSFSILYLYLVNVLVTILVIEIFRIPINTK
jgi:DNA primase